MEHDQEVEFGILGNLLLILALDAGGKLTISRDRWKEIDGVLLRREYDQKTNSDTLEIIGTDNEVLM